MGRPPLVVGGAYVAFAALAGCSLLVGDGEFAVGHVDAAAPDAGVTDGAGQADAGPTTPATAAVMVSTGLGIQNSCAVTFNGDVECWGDNTFGQLGDGTTTSSATPITVKGLPGPASAVSVGGLSTCALLASGAVMCWGSGPDGQLGNGVASNLQSTPVQVQGLESGVVNLSSGLESACAVKNDGTVWCWGLVTVKGPTGPLLTTTFFPLQVPAITTALTVSAGDVHACALLKGGAVVCWGGQAGTPTLGDGTSGASVSPVHVKSLASGVTSLSVGLATSCAVTAEGAVLCWGIGQEGELAPGSGPLTDSTVPVPIAGLTGGVRMVAAGTASVCALKNDASVWCWGFDEDGQLGDQGKAFAEELPIGAASTVPVKVEGLSEAAVSVTTGTAPCVVTASGGIDCWGRTGEIANTPVAFSLPTTEGTAAPGALSLSVGGDEAIGFACAVTTQGAVACWGSGLLGTLGDSSQASSAVPVVVSTIRAGATAVATAVQGAFACAIVGGLVECWGDGDYGTLGDRDLANHVVLEPITVVDLPAGMTRVSVGQASACAVSSTGALYCWGDNRFGQLGDGTTVSSATPVETMLSSGVLDVAVGDYSTCALLADGSVDCWGDNANGQLGNGTRNASIVPSPVSTLSNVKAIANGAAFACAATADNVYCWGYGDQCELGNQACASSTTPMAVAGQLPGATQLSAGYQSACAVVQGGAYCWGNYAVGDGSPTQLSPTPEPVTGLDTGVTRVAVGYMSACAAVHGTVKCWGNNSAGQLGNGGAVNSLVATPVPGFP